MSIAAITQRFGHRRHNSTSDNLRRGTDYCEARPEVVECTLGRKRYVPSSLGSIEHWRSRVNEKERQCRTQRTMKLPLRTAGLERRGSSEQRSQIGRASCRE